jgi:hypothetical protein
MRERKAPDFRPLSRAFIRATNLSNSLRRHRIAPLPVMYYSNLMKTLTVRLPEALVAEIEAESRERRRSKSDVVRERLSVGGRVPSKSAPPAIIADVIGAVDGLPADLSSRKKAYLKKGYGRNRSR